MAVVVLPLILVINLGYWEETIQTLSLILFSTLTCIMIGVPMGIAAAHRPWLYNTIRPVLDLMQTIPTFVYLIPTMIMFGLGVVPGLISTVIFAIPAPIRLTYLGISSVPKSLVEAGAAFGATRRQLLWEGGAAPRPAHHHGGRYPVHHALPVDGRHRRHGWRARTWRSVLRALNTVNIANGFEAGLSIVIVAILLDRICKQRGGDKLRS